MIRLLIYYISFAVALAFMLVCREVDCFTMKQQIKLFFVVFGGIVTIMVSIMAIIKNSFTNKNLTHLMVGELALFLGYASLFI